MRSFAPIALALAAFSSLSLASPAGTSGRGVAVSTFAKRNLLAEGDYNSAGPHHKGTRRHLKPATKFARRRLNKKRQDCDDDEGDDSNQGDGSDQGSDSEQGDDSGNGDSSSSGSASAAYPSSSPSYGTSSNGSGNSNKADKLNGNGYQSSYPASAAPTSSGQSSSGSSGSSSSGSGSSGSSGYDSSLPQGLQGTVTGTATYYFQGGAAGSCGTVAQDSDKVVAVSQQVMKSSLCGKTVQITNTSNGKSVSATIRDTCPGCEVTHLDLSQGAFDAIGDESTGVLQIKFTIS